MSEATKWTKEQREELRREWVKALRSGEYKQTRRHLEDATGNCCLGVACRVFDKLHPRTLEIEAREHGVVSFNGTISHLPDPVQEAMGLRVHTGHTSKHGYLTDMNDRGTPFATIADIIESKPADLFVEEA